VLWGRFQTLPYKIEFANSILNPIIPCCAGCGTANLHPGSPAKCAIMAGLGMMCRRIRWRLCNGWWCPDRDLGELR
jgi:hypothetical protein